MFSEIQHLFGIFKGLILNFEILIRIAIAHFHFFFFNRTLDDLVRLHGKLKTKFPKVEKLGFVLQKGE